MALCPYLDHVSPSTVASVVLAALTGKATVWAHYHLKCAVKGTSKETLEHILTILEETFSDPNLVSNSRASLESMSSGGKSFTEFYIEFQNLCNRARISLDPTAKNSEACHLWIMKMPRKTYEGMRTVFGNLYNLGFKELVDHTRLGWVKWERKTGR